MVAAEGCTPARAQRLVGLGGAELGLPLLKGCPRFVAIQAVTPNKAISLVVVASASPFRATVPFSGKGFELVWGFSCQVVVWFLPVLWFGAGKPFFVL
jgi:uncharacterized protein